MTSHDQGCLTMLVSSICLAFIVAFSVAKCSSNIYYKEQARLESERAVMRARSDAIKAEGKARAEKWEREMQAARSQPRATSKRTETIVYRTPHTWSGVGTKSKLNPDGTITITLDPRHAAHWDKEQMITRLLDDIDVEDLYDYYDFEPPEGY